MFVVFVPLILAMSLIHLTPKYRPSCFSAVIFCLFVGVNVEHTNVLKKIVILLYSKLKIGNVSIVDSRARACVCVYMGIETVPSDHHLYQRI